MISDIIESSYEEKIIEEILDMMKTNLFIMYNCDDNSLINLRKHCRKNYDKKYKPLSYQDLLFYVEEALGDLINYPFLYDFRPLE